MWCLVADAAFGQQGGPGTAWTAGVDFQSNSPVGEDTWAFDAVEMDNGDFVVVGYAETNNGATRVPAYAVLDKFGVLKHSLHFEFADGAGAFAQIAKTNDGDCIIAGWQGPQALLVKLGQDYIQDWERRFDIPPSTDQDVIVERLHSVTVCPDDNILLSGGFKGGTPDQGATFFSLRDQNGNEIPDKTVVLDFEGKILDCKTVTVGPITYVLSTGFKVVNDQSWEYQVADDANGKNADDHYVGPTDMDHHRYIFDYDVLVGIFNVEDIGPSMNASIFKYFNSKRFDYNSFGIADALIGPVISSGTTDIWKAPTCTTQFGPCTPGKSESGWGTASPNGSPMIDRYFGYDGAPRPSFVSKDVGRSIVYSHVTNQVYVAAEMNTLEMTAGFYRGMHRDGLNGVVLRELNCSDPEQSYGAYKDAYVHILKFDLNGNLATDIHNVENVAHCSGGDFYATIVVDQSDGKIVLGTTTGDRNICNLPAIDECEIAEVHFLAKYDPVTLQPVWQQHYLADVEGLEGSCAFGLIQTADGGFVMVGNNETVDQNGGEDETFTIVKFTSDCQEGESFDQDGDFIVTGTNDTWSPATLNTNTYRVRGNIIIPSGKRLNISGLNVQFAYSKNDPERKKSGITVKPGGKLYVYGGAVLEGINCGGEQMWDGITVEGLPNSSAGATQGYMFISGTNTKIKNAVRGTVLGGTAWADEISTNSSGNGDIGTLYTSTYHDDLEKGGGKIEATYGVFTNCAKGVVWNPMSNFSNRSKLSGTKFEFSAPLADGLYKASNEGPSTGAVASELGCHLRSVKDITFSNISCINTMADGLFPVQHTRPSGIYAVDSKFTVNGGAYNPHYGKLYVGVESSSAIGGAASTLNITSNFNRVYQGVNVRGNVTPVVSGCQFNHIPDKLDSDSGDPAGVHSVGTQGINLSANFFDSQADYDNYAARIDNSLGTGGAKVEFNTFTDMNVGNRFENDNTSLQTHCNIYQGAVGDASWDVKGPLADQIDFNNLSYFPDNMFLWDCIDPILLDIQSATVFSYHERVGQSQNNGSRLLCYTQPEVAKIPGNGFPPDPNCGGVVDPCPNPPYCNELFGLYTSSGNSLPYRNNLLNAYVRMSPTAVADSLYLPGTTRAISLLSSRNQQEDKRILAATYASLGNYTAAQQYLQQVTGSGTETQDFIAYYTVLINAGLAGRDAYHLTVVEFSQLAPLMTHNSTLAEQVKVLDHILNGVYHPLETESGSGNRPSGRSDEDASKDASISGLAVYPNPFSDGVDFVAPNGAFVTALAITDISGKVVFERKYASNEQYATWQANGIAEGILFYQCRLSNGEVVHGKLIYSKKR